MTEFTISPTILPPWLSPSTNFMACHHNKQDFGIFMLPDDYFNLKFLKIPKSTVFVRFLGNDSRNEETIEINKFDNLIFFKASHTGVPFIDCPLNNDALKIEFTSSSSGNSRSRKLPTFNYNDNQDEFVWNDEPYALVKSSYVQLLVPIHDKEALLSLDINKLLYWYQDVLDFFDDSIGLNDDGHEYNLGFNRRYFIKADINGAGGAAYTKYFLTQTGPSMVRFYLRPEPINWGGIHELAHGYDLIFPRNGPVPLNEVWNNLLCDRYQLRYLPIEQTAVMENNIANSHNRVLQQILSGNSISNWSHFDRLLFFSMIMNLTDSVPFKKINIQYRMAVLSEWKPDQTFMFNPHMPMIHEWWSNNTELYDLHPLFTVCGLKIDDWFQKEQMLHSNKLPVLPLGMLVSSAVESMKLTTVTDITSTVELQFIIDNFADIRDDLLIITNDNITILTVVITDPKITITINAGIYKMYLPRGRSNQVYYITNSVIDNYLIVKDKLTVCEIRYIPQIKSMLQNANGRLYGLNDRNVGYFCINYVTQQINIEIPQTNANSNFNKVYIELYLQNQLENTLQAINIVGNRQIPLSEVFNFDFNYIFGIFHNQATLHNRLIFIDIRQNRNNYIITPKGVHHILNTNYDYSKDLENKIIWACDYLEKNDSLKWSENLIKDSIYSAIKQYPIDQQTEYLNRFRLFLPRRFTVENIFYFNKTKYFNSMVLLSLFTFILLMLFKFVKFLQ